MQAAITLVLAVFHYFKKDKYSGNSYLLSFLLLALLLFAGFLFILSNAMVRVTY